MALSDRQLKEIVNTVWLLDYEGGRALKYLTGQVRESILVSAMITVAMMQDGQSFTAEELNRYRHTVIRMMVEKTKTADFFV